MTTREEIEYLQFMQSDIARALHELQRKEYAEGENQSAHDQPESTEDMG